MAAVLQIIALFALTILAAQAHENYIAEHASHGSSSLTGRWYVIATSVGQNLDGRVCIVTDIVRQKRNNGTRQVYSYQYNYYDRKKGGTLTTFTSRFEVEGRVIHARDASTSWFLVKRSNMLVSVNTEGVLALARSPTDTSALALARLLLRVVGRAPFVPSPAGCVYAPHTAPRFRMRRFVGRYRALSTEVTTRVSNIRVRRVSNGKLKIRATYSDGVLQPLSATLVRGSRYFPARFRFVVKGAPEDPKAQMWVLRVGRVRGGQYEYVVLATPQLDNVIVMWSTKTRRNRKLSILKNTARLIMTNKAV